MLCISITYLTVNTVDVTYSITSLNEISTICWIVYLLLKERTLSTGEGRLIYDQYSETKIYPSISSCIDINLKFEKLFPCRIIRNAL